MYKAAVEILVSASLVSDKPASLKFFLDSTSTDAVSSLFAAILVLTGSVDDLAKSLAELTGNDSMISTLRVDNSAGP